MPHPGADNDPVGPDIPVFHPIESAESTEDSDTSTTDGSNDQPATCPSPPPPHLWPRSTGTPARALSFFEQAAEAQRAEHVTRSAKQIKTALADCEKKLSYMKFKCTMGLLAQQAAHNSELHIAHMNRTHTTTSFEQKAMATKFVHMSELIRSLREINASLRRSATCHAQERIADNDAIMLAKHELATLKRDTWDNKHRLQVEAESSRLHHLQVLAAARHQFENQLQQAGSNRRFRSRRARGLMRC